MSYNPLDMSILKNILTNKKYALDFVNENEAKIFSPELWNFANIVIGYIKIYKEIPTLRIIVEKLSKGSNDRIIESIKNIWSELDKTQINDKEYRHDLNKIKQRFAEKQIISIRDNLSKLDTGSIDINKSVSELQNTIQSIKSLNQVRSYERRTLKDDVSIFRDEYNAKQENPNFDAGIKTGYSCIDYATDGFRPSELVLIGGESGGGKSMLLMNMAIQIWLQENAKLLDNYLSSESQELPVDFKPGQSVLYFSLEMPFKPCRNRIYGRLSGNPTKLIRSAKLNNNEANKLKKVLRFITKYQPQFEIADVPRGTTMEKMELIYEEAKNTYDPKVVVIDYLGIMGYDSDKDLDDWLKLGLISSAISEFARVHNITVLSAVQLNRNKGTKEEDKIGMHRIGRSAMIMNNANIAIQIETRANEKNFPDMKYHFIKNRDGELTNATLIKNLACGTLLDQSVEEDPTTFEMRDPDDISEKVDLLDI